MKIETKQNYDIHNLMCLDSGELFFFIDRDYEIFMKTDKIEGDCDIVISLTDGRLVNVNRNNEVCKVLGHLVIDKKMFYNLEEEPF